jgi:cytochrome c oxidase assembly protein subunit 15
MAVIALLAIQVVLGTQVREQIDVLLKTFGVHDSRLAWMGELDITVLVHRSFSWMLLIASWYLHRAYKAWQPSSPLTLMLLIGFVLIAVLGAMMYYLSIPAVIQPAHLLLTAVTWMIGVDVLVRSWQSTD